LSCRSAEVHRQTKQIASVWRDTPPIKTDYDTSIMVRFVFTNFKLLRKKTSSGATQNKEIMSLLKFAQAEKKKRISAMIKLEVALQLAELHEFLKQDIHHNQFKNHYQDIAILQALNYYNENDRLEEVHERYKCLYPFVFI